MLPISQLTFLEALYLFLLGYQKQILSTNWILCALGAAFQIISLILFQAVILKRRESPESMLHTNASASGSVSVEGFRYPIEILKLFAIIPLVIWNTGTSTLYLSYYLLNCGSMLGQGMKQKGVVPKLIGVFGLFWGYIFPALALVAMIGLIFFGNDMLFPIVGLLLAFAIFFVMKMPKKFRLPRSQLFEERYKGKFHQLKTGIQAGILIAIFLVPTGTYFYVMSEGGLFQGEEMVAMRDGVKLYTRYFYRRSNAGTPLPVVLIRTPYDAKSPGVDGIVNYYGMLYNFAVVVQDMRGRFHSQGVDTIFRTDYADGVDTAYWILNQSWCNGKIVTWGGSALGIVQYTFHAERAPGIGAASIWVGTPELYDYAAYIGGCLSKGLFENWLTAQKSLGQYSEFILANSIKNDTWNTVSLLKNQRFKNVNVRAVHVGGWFDCFSQGTIDGFMLYNYNATEYAKGHQILIMGPWTHGIGVRDAGEILFPENAANRSLITEMEHFVFADYVIGPQDWSNKPRVYYYVMGDPSDTAPGVNQWRTSMDWPIAHTYEQWYFHANGSMLRAAPSEQSSLNYIYDPANPMMNRGGTTLFIEHIGPKDQNPVENGRTDMIRFETPVFADYYEFVGRLKAKLLISSNCTDTDFVVKLMDVYPDGRAMLIADGILKTRKRNGFESDVFMTPMQQYEIDVDMWSTAYRVSPGHKLRVTITSSNYPKFAVNDNTGGPIISDLGSTYYYANNSVYFGYPVASALWLPVPV